MTTSPLSTPPDVDATAAHEPPSSWRAHMRSEASTARAAASLGWRMVKLRPSLLLWRLVGVGVGNVLSVVLWVMVALVLVMQAGLLDESTFTGLASGILALLARPAFIVGALGCAASVTAMSWWANAVSESGVWEACAEELDESRKQLELSLWQRATRHIMHVMVWQLGRGAVLCAGALMGAGVYFGLIHIQMTALPDALKVGLIALIYAAGLLYAALWLGIVSWYPAMALTHASMHPGERLLCSAHRALMHPVAIYRLLLHVIAPLVPLFFLSLGITLGKAFALGTPTIQSVLSGAGLLVDLVTFGAVVAAGMAWRAGSICLEASWSGELEAPQTLLARHEARAALGKSSAQSTLAHLGTPHPTQPEILQVSLADLRPTHAPNVLTLSELLAPPTTSAPDDEQTHHTGEG